MKDENVVDYILVKLAVDKHKTKLVSKKDRYRIPLIKIILSLKDSSFFSLLLPTTIYHVSWFHLNRNDGKPTSFQLSPLFHKSTTKDF